MRKVLPFIIGVLLLGCKTEGDVEPANESTFIRYFGSENNNIAQLALEEVDTIAGIAVAKGYTLLSTIQTPTDNFGHFIYQIQIIKTDLYGNRIAEPLKYPTFEEPEYRTADGGIKEGLVGGFSAASFVVLDNNEGYLIVGDSINDNEVSRLLLLKVNQDLSDPRQKSFSYETEGVPASELENVSVHGKAVTVDKEGNYLVLANIANNTFNSDDMLVGNITSDFSSNTHFTWTRAYGAGAGQLVNRIFYNYYSDKPSNILWGGSVTINDKSDLRIIQGPLDAQQTNLTNAIGTPAGDEVAADLCEGLNSYAFIGSAKSGQDDDIFFARVSKTDDPKLLDSAYFTFNSPEANLNEEGVAICETLGGGGFLLLADVESGVEGNGLKDFYLLKVNSFGSKEWAYNYGGSDNDQGASVRATQDGGYIMFGTTSYGNLKKLVLIKVNARGQL
jgi:hypothetical protein